MGKNVVIIGTLDTKGPEIAYLRDQLRNLGLQTTVVDSGILGDPIGIVPDITHAEAALYGNTTIEALQNAGSRGKAVEGMRDALKNLVVSLYAEGRLDAIVSMGGAEGAVMGAATMMVLPVGVPKVLVSPIASGKHYFDPLVGTSDIIVVHSIVDILGLNPIGQSLCRQLYENNEFETVLIFNSPSFSVWNRYPTEVKPPIIPVHGMINGDLMIIFGDVLVKYVSCRLNQCWEVLI